MLCSLCAYASRFKANEISPLAYDDTIKQSDPANARPSIILQQTVRDIQPDTRSFGKDCRARYYIVIDSVVIPNSLITAITDAIARHISSHLISSHIASM